MATVALSTKAIGDIVKIKVNGTAREFIVVHKGKPSSIYDASYDNGVILLMKDLYESRAWHSSNTNDYANSTIHSYLNSTFLNLIDADIRNQIVQVKVPYRPGSGTSKTVNSGASGLSAKIFLPAQIEVSSNYDSSYGVADGATWDYFAGLTYNSNQTKRVAYLNSTATDWWLRSPYAYSSTHAWLVNTDGNANNHNNCSNSRGIRPALVLPSSLFVSDDGSMVVNQPPMISDPALDQSLGNRTQGFVLPFTISEPDGETFSILAKINSTTLIDTQNNTDGTFSLDLTGATWSGLALTSHTITITATDTKGAATTRTLTFTKTNSAPTAPVITALATGQRIGTSGNVAFTPSTDDDGDTLTYTLQFASDIAFATDLQSFTGSGSPIAFSGIPINTSRYVRVVTDDSKTTTPSAAVQVKVGNVLEFRSNPVNRDTKPVSCRVLMDWTISEGATYTLYVCNNANDANPTWENCTSEFNAGVTRVFTNNSKTNSSWAVGLRVVINAGTATGPIEVRAFGFDITVS